MAHGLDVNHKDDDGQTCLYYAATYGGYLVTQQLILQFRADVLVQDKSGRTAHAFLQQKPKMEQNPQILKLLQDAARKQTKALKEAQEKQQKQRAARQKKREAEERAAAREQKKREQEAKARKKAEDKARATAAAAEARQARAETGPSQSSRSKKKRSASLEEDSWKKRPRTLADLQEANANAAKTILEWTWRQVEQNSPVKPDELKKASLLKRKPCWTRDPPSSDVVQIDAA